MTASFVLHRAARALASGEVPWGRKFFVETDGCRCALGVVAYAADPSDPDGDPRYVDRSVRPDATAAVEALADYLVNELGAPRCVTEDGGLDVIETVGGWNDEPDRTVNQVVAALMAAARYARKAVAA
jgi:hypothetical protein